MTLALPSLPVTTRRVPVGRLDEPLAGFDARRPWPSRRVRELGPPNSRIAFCSHVAGFLVRLDPRPPRRPRAEPWRGRCHAESGPARLLRALAANSRFRESFPIMAPIIPPPMPAHAATPCGWPGAAGAARRQAAAHGGLSLIAGEDLAVAPVPGSQPGRRALAATAAARSASSTTAWATGTVAGA